MFDQVETNQWHEVFASIIEDADANILLIDENFNVISLNPGFYWIFQETYGIDLKQGCSIIEAMQAVNPSLASTWKERCLSVMSGGPIKVEEIYEIDGREYHWEVYFKSLTLNDSIIVSVFSRDITIRKAYQKRILESEANVRSILNTIDHSLWMVNTRFELIDFNKEFYKRYKQAFGVKLERGKNILDLLPKDNPQLIEVWKERYENGLKGKPGRYYDSYVLDKEIKTYEIKSYPIIEDNQVTGLTIYSQDITQQKKTENILKDQNEELVKINSELDRFVYSASHDLRAPLMSVKGLLNMIKVDQNKSNTAQYLSMIEQSVNKLDNFISDIIHYSRNARMEVMPKEIDFYELTQESIDALKFMPGAPEVRSIKNIQVKSPFYSDYSRLLIVFNNMISNAVRYRDVSKEDSWLQIDVQADDEKATIRFSDNGIGIAQEYLEKVFKMFFRANADSKGSGLGLYIVKGVVEKLKGTLRVESTLGIGTTFILEVPNLAD